MSQPSSSGLIGRPRAARRWADLWARVPTPPHSRASGRPGDRHPYPRAAPRGALFAIVALALLCPVGARLEARSAEVRMCNGRPTLFIDGAPEHPIIYALTDLPGGRLTWEEMPQHNVRRMAEAGVRLFQFSLFLDQMWPDERAPLDISVARKLVRGVTDVCPEASIIIRLHLHPPQWWYPLHPDECVRDADRPPQEYDEAARFKRSQHNDPASGVVR